MPNTLIVPASGVISFSNDNAGSSSVPNLSSASQIQYDGAGGLVVSSLAQAASALTRFSVAGNRGTLLTVIDTLTATLSAKGVIHADGGNSNQWNSNFSTTQSNSASWSGAYTSFNANSSFYDAAVNELFTYVISETGDDFITEDSLLMVDSNIDGYPAWNSTTDTVYSLSAGWENTRNILVPIGWTNSQTVTGDALKWRSTYTSVCANSANWSSAYTTLCAVSAFITFKISKTITLTEFPNGYTFSDADNGNIYHVDTATSSISVLLPSNLSNNFNVTLIALGTNTMHISSTQVPILCATGSKVRLPFSSTLLYKYNNFVWGLGSLA
jgi:hypothetical protein